jgi:hypothetical protein
MGDKKINTVIKGEKKICYSIPQKHRQVLVDCECDEQTIGYHSNIDMPCVAADIKVKINQLNDRQNQDIESTNLLADSTICLRLETELQIYAEEANHFNTFERFYNLSDVFSISISRKLAETRRKSFQQFMNVSKQMKFLNEISKHLSITPTEIYHVRQPIQK